MDNFDEKMNYSFEPEEEQPQSVPQDPEPQGYRYYQQPRQTEQSYQTYQTYQQPEQPQKQKKDRRGLKIVALLLVVALVAGTAGAVLSKAISGIKSKNAEADTVEETSGAVEESPKAETPKPEAADGKTDMGNYKLEFTPLPESLKSNSGDKSRTPKDVYNMNVNAVVGITTEGTTNAWGQVSRYSTAGSGFVLTADGYVVTNNHVVSGSDTVKVKLFGGEEYEAKVIGTDATNDVALLKIEAENLACVSVADSDKIEVGEQVIAIGNPLGELTNTMTVGYISALDREINTDGTPINMLQTDAAINSGNSGGPLFDMNGNVIGITTAKYSGATSTGVYIESINFAIPINDAMRIVYDLQQYGYVKGRAYLGITLKDLDSTTASNYGLPVGPIIQTVTEGSCSEKAGMQPQDIVIGFEDKEITCYTDLVSALAKKRAGDTVTVKVFRAGAEVDLTITLDERPQDTEIEAAEEEANSQQTTPGTEVQPVNPDEPSGNYSIPFPFDPFDFFGF